ncbi:hypothetical protein GH714_030925 [Hevea brasiliensis]|uniref:Stomatal closure-related actin-binding protein coiled-coil domain-containing protein n=1 Tax=Hevea brasiliensis TaxID=3981 RepID=A0A6A6KJU8_HEVBR|nr:hypothetical protein GH714_030925 [Hevea brasiliensis]
MTKISPEIEEKMQTEVILPVSADVSFASNGFPKYKLGPDNQILEEPKEDNKGPSLKEVVEEETIQLSDQHKRLSVRDLASKFDKNLAAAAKLAEEAKLREVASLEGHVLLKKLRDALESLRGRMAGQNKEDVEKAISMASEDAKKLVNQEKSFACAEIESARAVVQRFGEALEEEERNAQNSKNEAPDVEELIEEVQEARRIKLLHQPTKVMEMEHELHALRTQIREKSIFSVKLQNELAMSKRAKENKSSPYVIDGSETLGSCLQLQPRSNASPPPLSKCSIQWCRISSDGSHKKLFQGQFDIQCTHCDLEVMVKRLHIGYLDLMSITICFDKGVMAEMVVISQMNGQDHPSHSVHTFNVGKMRIKLCRGWITKAREIYSASMQLCGVRANGNAAAKALFWQPRKGLSFVLTFESERERNAAIMIARKYALDCNVILAGPEDQL